MTDTSKPLTLREALEKILLHAQKLEDEIWWDDKVSPNKRIQEIIFHVHNIKTHSNNRTCPRSNF